jgi:hypothetical protein
MTPRALISGIEAINIAGRAIFGKGWIGEVRERDGRPALVGLSCEDLDLIARRGPQPGKRGRGITIECCPQTIEAQLDQALGRQVRASAQRGTAAQWLIDHRCDDHRGRGYDPEAIIAALKADPPRHADTTATIGRPRMFEAIGALMLAQVNSGERTRAEIVKASGKNLQKWYDADPATCKRARKYAF